MNITHSMILLAILFLTLVVALAQGQEEKQNPYLLQQQQLKRQQQRNMAVKQLQQQGQVSGQNSLKTK